VFYLCYLTIYGLGEKYISCDNDLVGLSNQDGEFLRLRKKNFVLGLVGLFFLLWNMVYAWLVPHHRHWTSHGLIISSVLRIIWYFIIPIFFILNQIGTFFEWPISDYYYQFSCDIWLNSFLLASVFALVFNDLIHQILDLEISKGLLYTVERTNKK